MRSSITNESNKPYKYSSQPFNQSIKLQIGDPNKTIIGPTTYIIKYKITNVLLQYEDHDEVYWNAIGKEWDTNFEKVSVTVKSPYAQIIKTTCYYGTIGSKEVCQQSFNNQAASFSSPILLSSNQDLTIVVGLNKQNQLVFPSITPVPTIPRITLTKPTTLTKTICYIIPLVPFLVVFLVWSKKGRDERYLSDNVYTRPEDGKKRLVSPFEREHLPMVYYPIQGLTPSQVGTIIDEKVDTKDIVAEIVELARLGYLEIQKIEKKKFFGLKKDVEYIFTNKHKDTVKLKEYQKYLLTSIFDKQIDISDLTDMINVKIEEDTDEETKEMDSLDKEIVKNITLGSQTIVSLSSLKEHFYKHLETYKKDLYQNLEDEKIFKGNPQTTKKLWTTVFVVMMFFDFSLSIFASVLSQSGLPFLFYFLSFIPGAILIRKMTGRTAWGHSLYRQITGLKYYIEKGKWREEIAEKKLFLEEILPLAIALGIVGKLAHDMEVLALEPPNYLQGFNTVHFMTDFSHFSTQTMRTFTFTSPSGWSGSWTGKSSWSGGSGFSGGFGGGGGGHSGGGFGGGGGGSW